MELPAAQEPSQITVTVFSARGLQSRRKGEVCQASVVFGMGKDYYRTEVVESNAPEWNQEAHIPVPNRLNGSLKFKVRDRDHTLGVVTINLSDLSNHKNERWLPLQPHKKSHEAHGDLLLDCWVSEYRAQPEKVSPATSQKVSPSTSQTSSMEDLQTVGSRGFKKFSFHRRTPSWSKSKPEKQSSSSGLVTTAHMTSPTLDGTPGTPQSQRLRTTGSDYEIHSQTILRTYQSDTNLRLALPPNSHGDSKHQSVGHSNMDDSVSPLDVLGSSLLPDVTGVSPNEGSVKGGQRVILRGSNLGESKEDVVKVVLASVDCTETVEYYSTSKLVVTTLPRGSHGRGSVVVETASGGVGVSSIKFTFVEDEVSSKGLSVGESSSPFVKRKTRETEELQAEVKFLKQQLRDLKSDNSQLKEDNASLRDYIDGLLLTIIDKSPDALEVKPSMRSGRGVSRSSDNFTQ